MAGVIIGFVLTLVAAEGWRREHQQLTKLRALLASRTVQHCEAIGRALAAETQTETVVRDLRACAEQRDAYRERIDRIYRELAGHDGLWHNDEGEEILIMTPAGGDPLTSMKTDGRRH